MCRSGSRIRMLENGWIEFDLEVFSLSLAQCTGGIVVEGRGGGEGVPNEKNVFKLSDVVKLPGKDAHLLQHRSSCAFVHIRTAVYENQLADLRGSLRCRQRSDSRP